MLELNGLFGVILGFEFMVHTVSLRLGSLCYDFTKMDSSINDNQLLISSI